MSRIALARMAAVIALLLTPLVAGAQAREVFGANPNFPISSAIRVGNMVYAAGQLPTLRGEGADTTIQGQTRSTLNNLKRAFEQAGTTMDLAVKCTVFLVEGADFQGMNQAYREFWPANAPARTTVVVKALVVPGAKLEIECIAAMPVK